MGGRYGNAVEGGSELVSGMRSIGNVDLKQVERAKKMLKSGDIKNIDDINFLKEIVKKGDVPTSAARGARNIVDIEVRGVLEATDGNVLKTVLDSSSGSKELLKNDSVFKKVAKEIGDLSEADAAKQLTALKGNMDPKEWADLTDEVKKLQEPGAIKKTIDSVKQSVPAKGLKKFAERNPAMYNVLQNVAITASGIGLLMLLTGTTSPKAAIKETIKLGAETTADTISTVGESMFDALFGNGFKTFLFVGVGILVFILVMSLSKG